MIYKNYNIEPNPYRYGPVGGEFTYNSTIDCDEPGYTGRSAIDCMEQIDQILEDRGIDYPVRWLRLTLKKEFFDMIAAGVKKEEYRAIKPYWERRLIEEKKQARLDATTAAEVAWREYDFIEFKNGYGKNAPTIIAEFKGVDIGKAVPEWSGNWEGEVFVIKIGESYKI